MRIQPGEIREIILREAMRAGVGHIGSALSIAEIISVLYSDVLRIPAPDAPNRDRLVLAKGHAALALYAALHLRGWIDTPTLQTYCADGTLLGVHPDHHVPGIDFSTGSLGQGICFAVGSALAAKMERSDRRVFVIVSDAECNEGSLWEAVMFAVHHRLSNVVIIVDFNHQQALGSTADILDLSPFQNRFDAFGCDAVTVDGHDCGALLDALVPTSQGPRVVIADTVFGKGVPFMERRVEWHYRPMNAADYARALCELKGFS